MWAIGLSTTKAEGIGRVGHISRNATFLDIDIGYFPPNAVRTRALSACRKSGTA